MKVWKVGRRGVEMSVMGGSIQIGVGRSMSGTCDLRAPCPVTAAG
ncbi:MAG: hypothetical protein AAF141_08095 [Pseudomonadota bacterium]